jgi:tetratricopeptide (TPR) repeat protein
MEEPMHAINQTDTAHWTDMCDQALRQGQFGTLETLLDALPVAADVVASFYRGRLSIARGHFEIAIRTLQRATEDLHEPHHVAVHTRCRIWIAYCHTMLGNYRLATTLVERIVATTTAGSHLFAEACFIAALVKADSGSLLEAKDGFEQVRDVAWMVQDSVLEARCCANLVPIYIHLGLLDRAGHMVQRVEHLADHGVVSHQHRDQIRNANVCRLRLMGQLDAALAAGLPLPTTITADTRHFQGWLTLSIAMVATDRGTFDVAEAAWERAWDILRPITDNHLSHAELLWERAWLRFRQQKLDAATRDVQKALEFITDQTDSEHLHAYAIAGIIDCERGDLALVSRHFAYALDRFRHTQHYLALASLLLHVAGYHLQEQRSWEGRKALAEGLTLLRRFQVYGAFYWHPTLVIRLCMLAIGEDWDDYAADLSLATSIDDPAAVTPDRYGLTSSPQTVLGDFATALIVRRLAPTAWETFVPLLQDHRARVRRRVGQILIAAHQPESLIHLHPLQTDPEPGLRRWYEQHVGPHLPREAVPRPDFSIRSFGSFDILANGATSKVTAAGTRKAKAILGLLLLAGNHGFPSNDIVVLLWPQGPPSAARSSFNSATTGARTLLKPILSTHPTPALAYRRDTGRYYLSMALVRPFWDFAQLDDLVATATQSGWSQPIQDLADTCYHPAFMDDFLDLLPNADRVAADLRIQWESVYDLVCQLLEEHTAHAAAAMEQLAQLRHKRSS